MIQLDDDSSMLEIQINADKSINAPPGIDVLIDPDRDTRAIRVGDAWIQVEDGQFVLIDANKFAVGIIDADQAAAIQAESSDQPADPADEAANP